MLVKDAEEIWGEFVDLLQKKCSLAEFQNWIAPIHFVPSNDSDIVLEVPNVFVQDYLLSNYRHELISFFPLNSKGDPLIRFIIKEPKREEKVIEPVIQEEKKESDDRYEIKLNIGYTFQHFIEGPSNQFVKSAAVGVALRPGKSYNPLFIHGGVGLGKTHLLHSIGHYVKEKHKKIKVQCITTEQFINDLVDSLRNKSVDQMKRFYRNLDILLVDDIQFLQSRLNFEEEFCNTFEALINQNKQVVITSDKPPSALKLSERLIARMEWGLVANIGIPDLETRVAILQYKAERKGLKIPQKVAFFIAEHIFNNVRQLEGAINRLSAYCGLIQTEVTQEIVETTLSELFQYVPQKKVTVESILKSVSSMFNVRVQDLRGSTRKKEVAFPRQVAMYLAKELINESLMKLASSFGGKTHSTLLHSWNKIKKQLETDETLRRQIQMTKQNLES
ncbi:MAG: chromosomal replication initiator protein DnaA [Chlamydiae bacterium]|jgi:chromosomal replication initiator protein|nr:chromosomal replication initiator protein DnaA [Chlamydiota bacterium]